MKPKQVILITAQTPIIITVEFVLENDTECIYISVNSQNYQNRSVQSPQDIIVEFALKNGKECTQIFVNY